jgi:outer membrane protein
VINSSSMVALILVPVLLAAASPAAAQGAAQLQPSQLSLVDSLRLGLQQNQQLKVAAFEVAVARAQLAQARAGTAIQGNVQASYTRTEEASVTIPGGGPTLPLSPNLYDTRLLLQYPLYSGGRVEAQIAMAEANLKGAVATLERITQQLIFTIRQAYYQLLLAQAGLDSANHSVTQAAENLRVARARVASGVSSKFDEVQADVALATARQVQVRARNGVAQGMQALNGLLNLPLETPLTPTNPFVVSVVETPLDRLIARALETRPELAEVSARQAVAQAGIQLAESGARFNLGLSGVVSYGNTGFIPTTDLSSMWSVTLAATLNVSDGGLTKDRIDEAKQRLEQLKATERSQRQAIELDVRQSFLNLQSAREELTGADALQAQAAEALRIANVRFAAGVGTSLEVLSAQASSSQAEVAKAQALFTYNVARAALVRAVGAEVN